MAEVKVNIGASVTGFQRGIREAIEGLNHFREHAKEVGKEVAKSVGGKDLAQILVPATATAAVAAFGVALVEAARKGIEAFSEFEQLTLRLKYNLANPNLAKPIAEALEKGSGAAGTAAERTSAYTTLLQAGIQPGAEEGKEEVKDEPKTEEMEVGGKKIIVEIIPPQGQKSGPEIGAGKILDALDQWAAKNGETQSQMAETLRVIHDRGADAGDGMTRALVSFKGLDQALAPQLAAFQAKQQPEQAAAHLEAVEKEKEYRAKHKFGAIGGFETQTELNEYAKLHKEATTTAPAATAVDMVKAHAINFQDILKAIVAGAPKGAVQEEAGTFKGHVDNLMARFDELEKAIGAALAPDLEMLMSEITEALPGLTAQFIDVAVEIERDVIPILTAFGKALGDAVNLLTRNQKKGGAEDVTWVSALQARGSIDVAGHYAYGHQEGETEEGDKDDRTKELNVEKDLWDKINYDALKFFHMTNPETMNLQRNVETHNTFHGMNPDGTKSIVDAQNETTRTLKKIFGP